MKPVLKAPGTKRLTLKCDKLLLNVAFKFNLRRYISEAASAACVAATAADDAHAAAAAAALKWREAVVYKIAEARTAAVLAVKTAAQGRAMQVDPMTPTLKAPGTKRLKLKYVKLLSISNCDATSRSRRRTLP